MKKNKEKKNMLIFLGIVIILFICLSILIITGNFNYIDTKFHSFILDIRNDYLTSFLNVITNFAGASFLLAFSFILLIFMKKKKMALYIFINLVLAFMTNEIFKSIFIRERPVGINLILETGYSFPSGHSMVALSFYGFIAYLLCRNIKDNFKKISIISSFLFLVLLIGFSRVYLGVHYISDVVGGFLLSIIYLTIYINVILRLEKK